MRKACQGSRAHTAESSYWSRTDLQGEFTRPPSVPRDVISSRDNEEKANEPVLRNIEGHNSQYDLPVYIVWLCKNVPESAFIRFSGGTFEVRMLRHGLSNLSQHGAETRVPIEHDNGGLRVPPAQIGEQLVYRFKEGFLALPEFAFGDENIFPVFPNEDVGFAIKIKRLARRVPLISTVELD